MSALVCVCVCACVRPIWSRHYRSLVVLLLQFSLPVFVVGVAILLLEYGFHGNNLRNVSDADHIVYGTQRNVRVLQLTATPCCKTLSAQAQLPG